jgi:phosphosulfolactate synthase (CoM biosynthesis protein A)
MAQDSRYEKDRAFPFIRLNAREAKPRRRGLTEIRGTYYSIAGKTYMADLLEMLGEWVDGVKFAGGSFALMPHRAVRAFNDVVHRADAYVSTGGWIEHVLTHGGGEDVQRYLAEAHDLGFDVIELSVGFISLPPDDLIALVKQVKAAGLQPKPELGIQFGAGGSTRASELAAEGTRDVAWLISLARRCLDAGAERIMIESEGITENVETWRTDAAARIMETLGPEPVMFEAADPDVFEWYVKNYGANVNLFVDHSQIAQLECLRAGIWGTKSTWGRIASYQGG